MVKYYWLLQTREKQQLHTIILLLVISFIKREFTISSVRSAIYISLLSKYFIQVLNFALVLIVARILTPEEIGVYAIVASLVMILNELKLMGGGLYIVREKILDDNKIRAAGTVMLLWSWGVGILLLFMSVFINDFYQVEHLNHLAQILSISFFIAPFSGVLYSLNTRALNYKGLMKAQVISQVVNVASTLLFLFLGFKYFSMAIGLLLSTFTEFFILKYISKHPAFFKLTFTGLNTVMSFGFFSSISAIINRLIKAIPELLIGKYFNTHSVGIFSRGNGFISFVEEIIIQAVKPVSLPILSNAVRNGDCVKTKYIESSVLLSGVCLPIFVTISIVAYPVILFLFGEQWGESVEYAKLLAVAGAIKVMHSFSASVLIACLYEKQLLFKQLVLFFISMLILFLTKESLSLLCYGLIVISFVDLILTTYLLKKYLSLGIFEFMKAHLKNIYLSFFAGGVAFLLSDIVDFENTVHLYSIVILVVVMPITWFSGIYLLKHPLTPEINIIFSKLINKRG